MGDPHGVGQYTDEWGATFTNIQPGIIGEVKRPLIEDWDGYIQRVHVPREWLTIDRDAVNRDCAATDKYVLAGCCPRPFEQLQFLRGTANLYMDLTDPPAGHARLHGRHARLLLRTAGDLGAAPTWTPCASWTTGARSAAC